MGRRAGRSESRILRESGRFRPCPGPCGSATRPLSRGESRPSSRPPSSSWRVAPRRRRRAPRRSPSRRGRRRTSDRPRLAPFERESASSSTTTAASRRSASRSTSTRTPASTPGIWGKVLSRFDWPTRFPAASFSSKRMCPPAATIRNARGSAMSESTKRSTPASRPSHLQPKRTRSSGRISSCLGSSALTSFSCYRPGERRVSQRSRRVPPWRSFAFWSPTTARRTSVTSESVR